MAKKQEVEVVEDLGVFNEMKVIETRRPDGHLDVGFDYSNCVSRTEQHWIKDGDLNYLIEKYTPDELAMYVEARMARRPEIVGHDFSQEPDLMGAKNIIRNMKQAFEHLDPEIKSMFNSHTEFVKFIDNPANQEKMIRMGIMTKQQISQVTTPGTTPTVTETKDHKEVTEKSAKS